jgi:hypothetical protein
MDAVSSSILNIGSTLAKKTLNALGTYTSKETTNGSSNATPTTPQKGSKFDETLRALLGNDPAKKVSEEELFSALIQERLGKLKGDGVAREYNELLSKSKQNLTRGNGYVPLEDAAKEALKQLQASGSIDSKEADSIYSQSFAAAQLDSNTETLFDDRGGANDPTIAVAQMEQALLLSQAKIDSFDSGAAVAQSRSLSEPSNGKSLPTQTTTSGSASGSDAGFLFKPTSESDGKLVVLLPPRLSGMVSSLTLIDGDGKVIENGRYTGNGNGGREHFRFSKSGGSYPDGLTVQAKLNNGDLVRYLIGETSNRTENISAA